jgi:hypothetical protein
MKKNVEELEQENAALHAFILQVSQRLFLAAEVLSIKAEKKDKRTVTYELPNRTELDLQSEVHRMCDGPDGA